MPLRSIRPFLNDENADFFCRKVLNELADFYSAATDRSRSAAGEHLLKTPSAIAKNLRSLETTLKEWFDDLPLLDSTHKKHVDPTEAGRLMLQFAKDVLSRSEQLLQDLQHLQNDAEVRLASIYSSWETYGAQLTEALRERMPNGLVTVTFFNDTNYIRDIEAAVRTGRADIGITSYPPKDIAAPLTVLPLVPQEMMLVVPSLYRKVPIGKQGVSLVDLVLNDKSLKFVIYDRSIDIPANRKVINYLKECGVAVSLEKGRGKTLEGTTITQIKSHLLGAPDRVSILPASAVKNEVAAGTLMTYPLYPPMDKWPWGIICHPLNYYRPSVRHFVKGFDALREI